MRTRRAWVRSVLAVGGLCATFASAGCQVEVGGQTLPSPHYLTDDVQYYEIGPEFKLSREAAAMRAYQAEQELAQGGGPTGLP